MTAPVELHIDFVSDVVCPWCAIGLAGLQQALARLDGEVRADIHLQPFELSPDMPPEGEDTGEHVMAEYGISEAEAEANRATIRSRAAAVGLAYNTHLHSRIRNTFDAHRLLHWAGLQGPEKAVVLEQALFRAYFTEAENVADRDVLVRIAEGAGLNAGEARRVLDSSQYAAETRTEEHRFQQAGIRSVPATIVNGRYLISGGQPSDVFEGALKEIAANARAA
ncbi:MAG: DsbA family oxidoreductase [Acetobacteraceae bacterium]